MLHQNRPVKETDRRRRSRSGARCPESRLWESLNWEVLKAQMETWSDFSGDPMPCAWDWTGHLQRYLPTWMMLWFSWCPNRENSFISTSGMPKNYLQLDTREEGSGFSVVWTLLEVLILKNVLWTFLNAAATYAITISPQTTQYNVTAYVANLHFWEVNKERGFIKFS